jgi:hypothetical protein
VLKVLPDRELVALEIAAPGHTFRVQTLFAGDELGWSALLMGEASISGRTLERVDALAFEGPILAACGEDTLFGFTLMHGCWASWPNAYGQRYSYWTCTR